MQFLIWYAYLFIWYAISFKITNLENGTSCNILLLIPQYPPYTSS